MKTITFDETRWQVVPKEPTLDMGFSGCKTLPKEIAEHRTTFDLLKLWDAMLAAAPIPKEAERPNIGLSLETIKLPTAKTGLEVTLSNKDEKPTV